MPPSGGELWTTRPTVDARRRPVGSTGEGQLAAFDPEPVEEADELAEEVDDEEDDDEEEDSVDPPEDLPDDELLDVPLVEAVSLALAAFRLSVR